MLFALLMACAEPFDVDRHHLTDFRILHAQVHDNRGDVVVWGGEAGFHSSRPLVRWYSEGVLLAEGFDAELPHAEMYELEVENNEGLIKRALVPAGYAIDIAPLERQQWFFSQESSYSLESRAAVETLPAPYSVAEDAVACLIFTEDSERVRWAANAGTILELSMHASDLFLDQLSFDEGELVEQQPQSMRDITLFSLHLDDDVGSGYRWIDVHFGADEYVMHHEMMVPFPREFAQEGYLAITLLEENGRLQLSQPEILTQPEGGASLSCMNGETLFELSWLRQGRCGLDEVDGHRVILEVR